jgi:hypothetical protein
MQKMSAEILFLDPDDVEPAIAELTARGFEVEILPGKDPCGPTVFIMARLMTELSQDAFHDLVHPIVEAFNSADLVEWGLDDPRSLLRGGTDAGG